MSARVVIRRIVLCLTLLASLGLPTLARANAYHDVLAAYQRHGSVPACQFSSHELSTALKEEDTYDAQYFADFSNSVETALESQASGQCSAGGSAGLLSASPAGGSSAGPAGGSPAGPAGGSSASGGAGRLASLTAPTSAGIPAPIILTGLTALLVALAAGVIGLAASAGWDPAWAMAWRHGVSEASYRLSAMAAELGDWRHSGRRRPSV